MNVLIISGSPRNMGNTAFLLELLKAELESLNVSSTLVKLSNYDIKDCDGCLICEETNCTGDCSIQDQMTNEIVPLLLDANAVVFGTPCYFNMPSGQMKRFIDRSNMILTKLCSIKLFCGIVVVGQSELSSVNAAFSAIQQYCGICHMVEVEASPVCVIARDIGDAQRNKRAIDEIKNLAKCLASK